MSNFRVVMFNPNKGVVEFFVNTEEIFPSRDFIRNHCKEKNGFDGVALVIQKLTEKEFNIYFGEEEENF